MGWATPAGSGALGRSGPGVPSPRERTSRSRSCGRSSPGTRTPSAPCAARYAPSATFAHAAVARTYLLEETEPTPPLADGVAPPEATPSADARLAPRPTRLPARLPTRLPTPGPSARGCCRTSSPGSHCPRSSRSPVRSLNPRCGRSARGWPRPSPRCTRQAGSTATSSPTTSGWTERAAPASWTSVTPSARARRRRPSGRPALSRLSARAAPLQPRAADTFALGALLFEIAVGSPACGVPPDLERLRSGRVSPPSNVVPRLSPLLDAIVLASLAPRPADRPTCATVARVLEEGEASRLVAGAPRGGGRRPGGRGPPGLAATTSHSPAAPRSSTALRSVEAGTRGRRRGAPARATAAWASRGS